MFCSLSANCPPCLEAPKIYEELQCVGGKSQGDCCDTKYNCSSTVEKIRAGAKCILQGTEIGIGEKVSVDLLPPCVSEAKCVSSPNGPKFDYVSRDVPKLEEGCLPQYSLDDLCVPKKLICDENGKKNLAKCESHGHVYHEGELFSHPSFSVFSAACYSCVCDGQFDNSTIPSMNKNCRKLDCGIEIYNIEKIRNGCVPVFRSNGASSSEVTECCPVNWICREFILNFFSIYLIRFY